MVTDHIDGNFASTIPVAHESFFLHMHAKRANLRDGSLRGGGGKRSRAIVKRIWVRGHRQTGNNNVGDDPDRESGAHQNVRQNPTNTNTLKILSSCECFVPEGSPIIIM